MNDLIVAAMIRKVVFEEKCPKREDSSCVTGRTDADAGRCRVPTYSFTRSQALAWERVKEKKVCERFRDLVAHFFCLRPSGLMCRYFFSFNAACAAASLAIGTRKGEQLT